MIEWFKSKSNFVHSYRYAYDILELEELNRRLEDHLSIVQAYNKDLSLEQGVDGGDASHETKNNCELEAQALFDKRSKDFKYKIQSESMANLITKLTAMLLQLKVRYWIFPVKPFFLWPFSSTKLEISWL